MRRGGWIRFSEQLFQFFMDLMEGWDDVFRAVAFFEHGHSGVERVGDGDDGAIQVFVSFLYGGDVFVAVADIPDDIGF